MAPTARRIIAAVGRARPRRRTRRVALGLPRPRSQPRGPPGADGGLLGGHHGPAHPARRQRPDLRRGPLRLLPARVRHARLVGNGTGADVDSPRELASRGLRARLRLGQRPRDGEPGARDHRGDPHGRAAERGASRRTRSARGHPRGAGRDGPTRRRARGAPAAGPRAARHGGAGLTSIVTHLEAADQAVPPGPGTTRTHLATARRAARDGLGEIRRTVRALRPDLLDGASLPEALRRTAALLTVDHGVPTQVRVTGVPIELHPDTETALLRIAQESLTNVARHARAGRAVVTLSYVGDAVTLDINDDGTGFDPGRGRTSTSSARPPTGWPHSIRCASSYRTSC
ncbi:sensor histidine kinase [Pseudonocardia sp. GCM10023141]|uniref:sensor histidine kinase n=1 Tax=Pseudonocardia sp. GCM10023141 TaxID=3252653 RepID=UPI00361C7955